ncbi:MAG TPA: hypothetical protein VIK18_26455 [Pirellulales bacterium]
MWRKIVQLNGPRRALLLVALMLVLGLAMAPLAWHRSGSAGLLAEAVAGGLSLAGALVALAVFARFSRPDQVLYALAGGMLLRTALPLSAAAALYLSQPRLAEADLLLYLIAFYLPALALETVLIAAQAGGDQRPRAGSSRLGCQHGRS